MIATWKIRTDYANATDIFDKVSPWFKESGAQMSAMLLNIGGHDGTFTMAAAFENFEAFGKNDDAWSSSPEWWQKMQPNFVNNELLEAVYMNEFVGNIKSPSEKLPVFANFIFSHPDFDAVMKSFEIDEKHYMNNGSTGLAIHGLSGDRNNQYLFLARFNSMQELGKCMDVNYSSPDYWSSHKDYYKDLNIRLNFNSRVIKRDIY
jgi:hypothetical protein|tara:strand:- start:1399 stop:2013 length:615 start_codon:yes stop_codon:yes gene_type:complete